MAKLADLPADLRAYLEKAKVQPDQEGAVPPEQVLAAIGVTIGALRDEAKQARVSSGIEERWRDAEEAYAGIDDANRHEVNGGHQWTKSMSTDGPITSDDVPDTNNRSTLYVRLTQRYVDAGTAKLGEIILAPGAKSFSFSPTPVPDLINAKEDKRPILLDHLPGSPPAMIQAKPGEIGAPSVSGAAPVPAPAGGAVPPAGAAGPFPPGQQLRPLTPSDLAKERLEIAEKAAKKAEQRIHDWHVECRRTSQVRKVIFDSGRLGVGILKGPVPKASRQIATRKGEGGIELGIRNVVLPASKWVNVWNFFPDPSCGEDIHDGDHCFEREWMGARAVRKLKGLPGYIPSQIDKVLLEGPNKINLTDVASAGPQAEDAVQLKKGKFETWYFHGTLTRAEMGCICEAAGPEAFQKFNAAIKEDQEQVYAIVTLINDSVVKATVNPLDSGEFPYHAMPWQRRTGSWAGVGIAEQIATPQKMLTAAVRAMLDNAGISAGGQIVIDTSKVSPADGDMGMSPHKIWYANGDGETVDVHEAFGLFKIDNVTAELMQIVELAMRLGEESTSIPLITQGQSGPTTPDTFGAAQLQNNNANQLLRSIAYTFDDCITEPETRQYYEWLLLDPDVPDDEKGDWTIDAHGSNALVEQAIQDQFLAQIGPMVLNPAYGANPKKWFEMMVRSKKMQPKDLQYTDEELASLPKVSAPQVEVAQIRAATEDKKIAAIAADTKADNEREDKRLATESTVELHTLQLKRELAMLEYANREKTTLDTVKAKLAETVMKLQAQERLAARGNGGERPQKQRRPQRPNTPQVATPAVEPRGRAPDGQAFQA
jgi:hypothetical protein